MTSVHLEFLTILAAIDMGNLLWASLFVAAALVAIALRFKLTRCEQELKSTEHQVELALHRRRAAMEFCHILGSSFEQAVNMDDLLRSTTAFFMRVAQATGGVTYLVDQKRQRLRVGAMCGTLGGRLGPGADTLGQDAPALALNGGLLGESARSGRPVFVNDSAKDTRLNFLGGNAVDIKNAMAVPLRFRGKPLGVTVVVNRLGDDPTSVKPFGRFEFQILESMSLYASTAMQLTLSYLEQAEQQRLDFDLGVAGEIQRLLLPQHAPVVPGAQIAGHSRPAHRVGGDLFNFIDLGDSRLGVVVADVSGKGVTGALVMAMCHAIVRSEAPHHDRPAEAVKAYRKLLMQDIPEDRFVTMLYGILTPGTGEFSFARAGHDALLVYRQDTKTVERLSPKGGAIGLHPGDRFDRLLQDQTVSLASGDCVVLFTDGLTERTNAAGQEFGMNRLVKVIEENAHLDVRDLEEIVFQTIQAFAGDQRAVDDETLVIIKRT